MVVGDTGQRRRCFPGKGRQCAELKGHQLANSFTSKKDNKTENFSCSLTGDGGSVPSEGVSCPQWVQPPGRVIW